MQAQYQAPYIPSSSFSFSRILKGIYEFFCDVSSAMDNASNLHIERIVDDSGNTSWFAYNPQSGATFCAASETELVTWVEHTFSI